MLKTESPSDEHADLDCYPTLKLVQALATDQQRAVQAVRDAAPKLALAVEAALPRIESGGRLVYAGAGTSGRLGLLDSVELNPTFGWPQDRVLALIAGGRGALVEAVEGAEDDSEQGAIDIRLHEVGGNDVVLLIAASGTTPYVLGALQAARAAGALTIGIANNPGSPLARDAEIGIVLDTGPEAISGSTRLKAGTAQKIALNTFSSALMVRLHKVYGNLMVDLRATNAKLRRRALALTMHASGADELAAERALRDSGFRVKVAIVALRAGVSVHEAGARLEACRGSVREALAAPT
ncbi:MAG: N-acetylmuramic acid 6-phosphate etherase [Rubrivivax sp.]|jgi:N-acetylmuramic acid 6-phosphate etherase|nr:N-acetylmuramic acid 6-phosphate etherase [Rubrivivax sp.]